MLKLIAHFGHQAALSGVVDFLSQIPASKRGEWGVQVLHASTPPSGFLIHLNVASESHDAGMKRKLEDAIRAHLEPGVLFAKLIQLQSRRQLSTPSPREHLANLNLVSGALSHMLKDGFLKEGPSILSIAHESRLSSIALGSLGFGYQLQRVMPELDATIQLVSNELARQADMRSPLHEQILDRLKRIEGINIMPGRT